MDLKIPTKHAGGDQNFNSQNSTSFETNISQLGKIIKDINLALNLGLEGIVEHCQSSTEKQDFWSTCRIVEALEGAMNELKFKLSPHHKNINRKNSSKGSEPVKKIHIDQLKFKGFLKAVNKRKRKNGYDGEKSNTSSSQKPCPSITCPQWKAFITNRGLSMKINSKKSKCKNFFVKER